jgi:uncharacterized protein (DUF427 family)
MSLTLGTGPLTRRRTGTFNFDIDSASPAHTLYLDDVPQRVRAVFNGETVVDTRGAKVLFESNIAGQWYLPEADVRDDLLVPTETTTHCPFKGDAIYWTLSVGDRTETDVCWSYPEPLDAMPGLKGLRAFYFGRMDAWFEEDEEVFAHPRDPYHRCDARRSSDRVTVRVGDAVVAQTNQPVALFETSLPPRWYISPADVQDGVLAAAELTTVCPYKGTASYRSVAGVENAAWVYEQPFAEVAAIAGWVSFDPERVDVSVEPAP